MSVSENVSGERLRDTDQTDSVHLDDLIADTNATVAVHCPTGRDRFDEYAQLLQPRIRAHAHSDYAEAQSFRACNRPQKLLVEHLNLVGHLRTFLIDVA